MPINQSPLNTVRVLSKFPYFSEEKLSPEMKVPLKLNLEGRTGTPTPRSALYPPLSTHVSKATNKSRSTPPLSSSVSDKPPSGDTTDRSLIISKRIDGSEVETLPKQRASRKNGFLLQLSYHEFMKLDQAGPAVMGCDNTRERKIVAVKRLKGVYKAVKHMMVPFTTDQVVNVLKMFFDNNDLVVIYEHMHISLRPVTSILQGSLKDFQIAGICREVKHLSF